MNQDLAMLLSLRRALDSAAEGKGMARALVQELPSAGEDGADAARLLLLGRPLSDSLNPLTDAGSEEVAILATLILGTRKSSAIAVGTNGKALAATLERWVKTRESLVLEQKVQRFRSLVTSGVLGAVTAMIASLGPLIGNLSFTGLPAAGADFLLPAAALMAGMSSAMLGIYMSGKKFIVNVAVTLAIFGAVTALASPLVNVSSFALWGVK